jgi:hypothetical protein
MGGSDSWPFAESFEKITSGGKNTIEILFVFLAVGLIFSSGMQSCVGKKLDTLAKHGVSSIKYGELEIKLRETEQKLNATQQALQTVANSPVNPAASPNTPKTLPQDATPAPGIAPALQFIPEQGAFWVYVGQYQNGHFLKRPNFNVTAPPTTGQELVAWTDTYRRNDKPVQRGSEWFLGKITGVVKEGESLKVLTVDTIEVGNIWVSAIGARPASE